MKGLRNRVFSILMAVFLVMGMMSAFGTVYAEDDASARGDSQSAASMPSSMSSQAWWISCTEWKPKE